MSSRFRVRGPLNERSSPDELSALDDGSNAGSYLEAEKFSWSCVVRGGVSLRSCRSRVRGVGLEPWSTVSFGTTYSCCVSPPEFSRPGSDSHENRSRGSDDGLIFECDMLFAQQVTNCGAKVVHKAVGLDLVNCA
jgi:hypothetical protein